MKIGILTWFCGINYGGQAQTYALAKILENAGHQCYEVAYYPQRYQYINAKMSLNIENGWYKHPKQVFSSLKRMYVLNKFVAMHAKTKRVANGEQIDKLDVDVLIIGSDEVVNCNHPFFSNIYLGVGITKKPVIFYAPSSGALDINHALAEIEKDALKRSIALSGRDKHTCDFLEKNSGRVVEQVLDPTILYDFKDLHVDISYKNYILLYSFDSLEKYRDQITDYANENKFMIVSVGRYYKWANISKPYASEEMWVSLFTKAELVITDSFHGLVFSIKNSKEVVLLGRGDKLNKNNDLLEELGITKRYLNSNENIEAYLEDNAIDYEKVNATLEEKKRMSLDYLKRNLEKIRCVI